MRNPLERGRDRRSAHTRLGNANQHCGFGQANYNFWPAGGQQSVWGSLKTSRSELPPPTTLNYGMKYFPKDQILLTIFSQHSFFFSSLIIFSWILNFFPKSERLIT